MMYKWIPTLALLVACVASDVDGDGFEAPEDCDDNAANINPDATDVRGNGLDEDCSGSDSPPFAYLGDWMGTAISRRDIPIDVTLTLRSTLTMTAQTLVNYDDVIAFDGSGNIHPDENDDDRFGFELDGTIVFTFDTASSQFNADCRIQGTETLFCTGIVYSSNVPWWNGEIFDSMELQRAE